MTTPTTPTLSLANKVALITGGTTGIGFATAKAFVQAGATVIVTGRNAKTLEVARAELGDSASVRESDAADPDAINALFADIQKEHGGIDVLFLNAGVAQFAPLGQGDLAHFQTVFDVNVRGPWLALQAASSVLNDGASVLVNTSVVNEAAMPATSVYAASKSALATIARVAGAEWKDRGIRVNAVSPGPIETPIYGKMGMPQSDLENFQTDVLTQVPLGRFGSPHEVANAALFLASDAASFVNGVQLRVDGGMGAL